MNPDLLEAATDGRARSQPEFEPNHLAGFRYLNVHCGHLHLPVIHRPVKSAEKATPALPTEQPTEGS